MTLWLIDEQMHQEKIVASRARARYQDFDRSEAEWDEVWEGVFAILAGLGDCVRRAFDLDLQDSLLFKKFPELLWAACDPQQPIVYVPVFREFTLPVFDDEPSFRKFSAARSASCTTISRRCRRASTARPGGSREA